MYTNTLDIRDHRMQLEGITDQLVGEQIDLPESQHDKLRDYLCARLDSARSNRLLRIARYAKIDQMIVTWQKLSKEDSERDAREELNGRQQAIPMNLPVAAAHIDDATSFYAEVFAPLGGNYYASPGKRDQSEAMKMLVNLMNQDSKNFKYYRNVCHTMRALNKYNFGGFHVYWNPGDKDGVGPQTQAGNVVSAIDVYNFFYDESIKDVSELHLLGEWAAIAEHKNRLWLMRQMAEGDTLNIKKAIDEADGEYRRNNDSIGQRVRYYKHPPRQTQMKSDGNDSKSSGPMQTEVDWDSFGLGDADDNMDLVTGHEVVRMYCFLNPAQFELLDSDGKLYEDTVMLWRFDIVDGKYIIKAVPMADDRELPVYMSRLNQDEMAEAARSIAEYLRPFQRFVSFLLNTHIEAVRSNVWGVTGYDPGMFDMSKMQNGETSGMIPSKIPGRDVRSGMMKLNQTLDTKQNMGDAGSIMDLMKQFFPNQALPAQIAGMDRAVNSQVSAVLQGAMRKLHMMVRLIDSDLMQPVRLAQYRNIARSDKNATGLQTITEEQVAELLSSGMGQIGREAAAEHVRSLLFALIQNPDSAQGYDIPGIYTLWSSLLNIGTDLGDFVLQQQPGVVPPGAVADPAAANQAAQPTQPPIA